MKRWGCTGHVAVNAGSRIGHCALCHRDFYGEEAWDKHRRGPWDARYCADPATDDRRTQTGRPFAQWRQDERGYWHEGARRDAFRTEKES